MRREREKQVSSQLLSKYSLDLQPQLEKIVSELGLRLLELSFTNENQVNYLRLTITHLDRNISLTDCEIVSKRIGKELDLKDLIPFSYMLEVQSRGITYNNPTEIGNHEFVLKNLGLIVKS